MSDSTSAYIMGSNMRTFDDDAREAFNGFNNNEKLSFIRGFFDTNGRVFNSLTSPQCIVRCEGTGFANVIQENISVPCVNADDVLQYTGVNVIDFLHILYKDVEYVDFNCHYDAYMDLLYCWKPYWVIKGQYANKFQNQNQGLSFRFMKTMDEAVVPKKAHVTDTGYDLCLIKKIKEENGMVMYDTGIAVQPPMGYYFELVGRSSISKTGYIVANSVGIIDASYTGSLKVALIKINKEAPELELPARLVQLIPRQLIHMDAIEVPDLTHTQRAGGGFGSSGR